MRFLVQSKILNKSGHIFFEKMMIFQTKYPLEKKNESRL